MTSSDICTLAPAIRRQQPSRPPMYDVMYYALPSRPLSLPSSNPDVRALKGVFRPSQIRADEIIHTAGLKIKDGVVRGMTRDVAETLAARANNYPGGIISYCPSCGRKPTRGRFEAEPSPQ